MSKLRLAAVAAFRRNAADRWRDRAAKPLFLALCLLASAGATTLFAQSRAPSAASILRPLSEQAAKGEFNRDAMDHAFDALQKAGMSPEEAREELRKIDEIRNKVTDEKTRKDEEAAAKKKKEEEAKKAADQNASGTGDWNFGQIYRDRDYRMAYPLTNNCKVPQTVSITYPTQFPLTGPTTVVVPAKSTVDVAMVLKNSSTGPMPTPPWPPGVSFACYDLKGDITLFHPKIETVTRTARGKITWVCDEMKRTHRISMHVHMHGPPDPPGGGGGGAKKKKPACDIYWNHGEFYPSETTLEPEQCRDDIRDSAREYFLIALQSLRAKDPKAWAWTPAAGEIARLSAAELVGLKARADAQAAGGR